MSNIKTESLYDRAVDEADRELFGFDLIEMKMPFEVYDEDEISSFFQKNKLVPYAGTMSRSGDKLLDFYNNMAAYSPTSSSCIFSKKSVFFGNKVKIVQNTDDVFDFEEEREDVPIEKKKAYAAFIKSINFDRDVDLKGVASASYEEFESNGNMAIEVEMFMVGKERVINFKRLETKHFRYVFTKSNERVVQISYKWTDSYLSKNPPRTVPVYPYASEKKGVFRTVIHEKNGNFWYGRAPSKGSVLNQYNEYQNTFYLNRIASKEFTPRVVMEVEDDAPNNNRMVNNQRDQRAGFKSTSHRFESRFTNASKNPSTFILMTRPVGSRPMAIKELSPNMNENYYEKIGEQNDEKVIQSHAWSKRLLGGDAVSLFSTGVYMDELKVKDATTNIYYQNKVHNFLDTAIRLAMDWAGVSLLDLSFEFQSPYIEILKKEKFINEKYGINLIDDDTNLVKQNELKNVSSND